MNYPDSRFVNYLITTLVCFIETTLYYTRGKFPSGQTYHVQTADPHDIRSRVDTGNPQVNKSHIMRSWSRF